MNCHTLLESLRGSRLFFLPLLTAIFLATVTVPDSFEQQDQTIILGTDKSSYLPGDVVNITGIVSGQPGLLVAIQVKDPNGNLVVIRTVQADQNGTFALQFKIPPNAAQSNFNIIASAKINGFVVTQTKVITQTTVPEFDQLAPLILVLSIILAIIFRIASFKNISSNITGSSGL